MKKFYVLCLVFGCLFGGTGLALTHTRAASLPLLYISEVNWAGSPLSLADEWLEITNGSREAVDLSGWIIDGAASSGGAIQIAPGVSIGPLSSVLIANYDAGNEKSTLIAKPDLVTSAISLANTNLTLRLVDPTGVVIDTATFGSSPSAGSTNPFASAIRLSDGGFVTATQSVGLMSPTQFGTPNIVDLALDTPSAETTPVEPSTDISSNPIVEPVDIEATIEPVQENPCCACSCEDPGATTPDTEEPALAEEQHSTETRSPVEEEMLFEAPEQSPETQSEPINTTARDLSNQTALRISEFVSDPVDSIEWIEFYNESESTIYLDGMYVMDATLSKTVLSGVIEAGAYGVIENPKGKLNNDSDQIHLYAHNDIKIDQVEYGITALKAAKKGESIGRINGTWMVLDSPSKGYANIANPAMEPTPEMEESTAIQVTEEVSLESLDETIEPDDTSTVLTNLEPDIATTVIDAEQITESTSLPNTVTIVSIAESPSATKSKKSSTKKQEETIQGIVTVPPGVLGKQIAYLEGYQVYFHKAEWPALNVGDIVQLTGTLSASNNENRFTIKSADAVTLKGHGAVAVRTFAPTEALRENIGSHFTFEGIIQSREKQRVDIDINSADIRIELPKDENGNLLPQDSLKGKGILRSDKNGFYLEVLAKADLEQVETVHAPAAHGTKNSKSVAGAGLFTGTLGVVGYWLRKSLLIT